MNGLAAAPPKIGCINGVSTSKNPFPSNILLIPDIIFVLFTNVSLTSLFIIRSTYLFLYLVSISVSPWNFSGNDLIFLQSRVTTEALIVSSPVEVRKSFPSTPMISPTPIFFTRA